MLKSNEYYTKIRSIEETFYELESNQLNMSL
jgi:hypothetical protein